MVSGIYKIEDRQGRIYIGSATNIASRWRKHKGDLNRNKHHSIKLQRAWNKYGADYFIFSIVEIVPDKAELLQREQIWLDILFQSLERVDIYNTLTKAGSSLGVKRSSETKAKMSLASKGNKYMLGLKRTQETKDKIAAGNAKTYTLLSPTGDIVTITNIQSFCRDNNCDASHMIRLARGKYKSHKGWRRNE